MLTEADNLGWLFALAPRALVVTVRLLILARGEAKADFWKTRRAYGNCDEDRC